MSGVTAGIGSAFGPVGSGGANCIQKAVWEVGCAGVHAVAQGSFTVYHQVNMSNFGEVNKTIKYFIMKRNILFLVISLFLITSCIKKSSISDSELEKAKRVLWNKHIL